MLHCNIGDATWSHGPRAEALRRTKPGKFREYAPSDIDLAKIAANESNEPPTQLFVLRRTSLLGCRRPKLRQNSVDEGSGTRGMLSLPTQPLPIHLGGGPLRQKSKHVLPALHGVATCRLHEFLRLGTRHVLREREAGGFGQEQPLAGVEVGAHAVAVDDQRPQQD